MPTFFGDPDILNRMIARDMAQRRDVVVTDIFGHMTLDTGAAAYTLLPHTFTPGEAVRLHADGPTWTVTPVTDLTESHMLQAEVADITPVSAIGETGVQGLPDVRGELSGFWDPPYDPGAMPVPPALTLEAIRHAMELLGLSTEQASFAVGHLGDTLAAQRRREAAHVPVPPGGRAIDLSGL